MADSLLGEVRKASSSLPEADLYDVNDIAADLIRQRAADLVVDLSRERQEVVRSVLAQAVKRGWSDTTIRHRLATVVGLDPRRAQAVERFRQARLDAGVPPSRAERLTQEYAKRQVIHRANLIADHEIRSALMLARRLVWQDMQARGDFSPWAVRVTRVHKDERLCPICRPQNGVRRSLNRDLIAGPPFHPRCRCDEEVVDQGIEKREDTAMPVTNPYCVFGDHGDKPFHETNEHVHVQKAVSPGGRPADASPLAKPGYKGGRRLVDYVRMIAHALMRKGTPKDKAIEMARGILQNWASGQGNVSAKVRAAAAKALAEQAALDKGHRVAKAEASTWNFEDYQMIREALEDEQ